MSLSDDDHLICCIFLSSASCIYWSLSSLQQHLSAFSSVSCGSQCTISSVHIVVANFSTSWRLEILNTFHLLPCRHNELQREATRCFNCGSYSHALRDCQRPRNYDAINSARSNHNSKKAFPSGPRVPVRYYQTPAGGKDDDERKPGGPARETQEPVRVCICEKTLITFCFEVPCYSF